MVKTREGHRATMYVSKQLSAEGTSETGGNESFYSMSQGSESEGTGGE